MAQPLLARSAWPGVKAKFGLKQFEQGWTDGVCFEDCFPGCGDQRWRRRKRRGRAQFVVLAPGAPVKRCTLRYICNSVRLLDQGPDSREMSAYLWPGYADRPPASSHRLPPVSLSVMRRRTYPGVASSGWRREDGHGVARSDHACASSVGGALHS